MRGKIIAGEVSRCDSHLRRHCRLHQTLGRSRCRPRGCGAKPSLQSHRRVGRAARRRKNQDHRAMRTLPSVGVPQAVMGQCREDRRLRARFVGGCRNNGDRRYGLNFAFELRSTPVPSSPVSSAEQSLPMTFGGTRSTQPHASKGAANPARFWCQKLRRQLCHRVLPRKISASSIFATQVRSAFIACLAEHRIDDWGSGNRRPLRARACDQDCVTGV